MSVQILVADIMKSLTIYRFHKRVAGDRNTIQMEARDPNGLWCIEMAQIPDVKTTKKKSKVR